ncbi:hypothetical protein BO94DRAFT_566493 [Aspergillus sclerotioniger CBS 115572]|uniref:SUN domain-containing protein n=1 Tax=Aspergillus sclerotioniger CBS 115572 TaxID=1450535 RepID=A0A317WHB5_9EURO|nr:hypothetical protein BO94DRAFT_566493 [Aspergillus sclerotioniger CBS 115572]PWY85753.1 hypothetical protein BO94DRAFT_566493 [Aspergillus sclerotioniger CBS 115572]
MTGWTATQWIPWMTLISTWIEGTAGDSSQSVCPARGWQTVEAEFIQWPKCPQTQWEGQSVLDTPAIPPHLLKDPEETVSVPMASSSETTVPTPDERPDHELDTESPLDNANFLSFEDWKKQNLAKVGQSAENVGGNRRGGAEKEDRRRPTGINNALDSLGDDVEIELDFGGFGADTPETAKPTSWGARVPPEAKAGTVHSAENREVDALSQGVPQAGVSRSKDAGTTCKERFNYASFDCAATVLKTNPECTGSSSVLIENKDSYMLNECRAKNKFLILELCDDILVDTVVLANYEFFSSIFHTFRVSVSDRYPAKPDQWRELGIFEARNTREVQAFAVENPLIWARYVRVEFLTHYGNEFFCPLSLIRVHGTTMLEEYKHDGEASRVEDVVPDEVLETAPVAAEPETTPTLNSLADAGSAEREASDQILETCPNLGPDIDETVLMKLLGVTETCSVHDSPVAAGPEGAPTPASRPSINDATPPKGDDAASLAAVNETPVKEPGEPKATVAVGTNVDTAPAFATTAVQETASQVVSEADSRSTTLAKEEQSGAVESTRPTAAQPPSSNPTTQESFFKSVNKRLQMLESNSSLSLLYIEEQSRILRDAFNKVEKRQLAKTTSFLENLNGTVLHELRQFREQYDHVWKSVALEFELQRVQYHQEVQSLSTQLGVLADELVFQKRVAVIQSIMILFCFGLVLFSRGAVSSYIELPSMQNMVSRSYSLRSSSPPFGSPSVSPTSSSRRAGGHRRNLSEDSQDGPISPTLAYSPPTPVSDAENRTGDSLALPEVTPPTLRSRRGEDETPEESSASGESPDEGSSDKDKLNELKAAPAKINSMEYHRQVLQGKLDSGDDKNQASYVSPSDDIMSPCSKKLSDLKGKRFKKSTPCPPPPAFPSLPSPSSATGPNKPSTWYFQCIPVEPIFRAQLGEGQQRWATYPAIMETLKTKARQQGLWNMFLPKSHFSQGAGFSNVEYGLMAEYLGKSTIASEATNNAAPDTGNMEVLAKYGNEAQKQQWLAPLLDGKIRSAFLMTEPDIASSDATNIELDIRREGNEYVLNGSKWWSSGAGDPRCQIYLVMGKTAANNPDPYKQQSVILVPAKTPGITVHRMLNVYGYDDAPHGHGHISFKDVRVPVSNIVLGEGRGFEIIQGRLGPGRIHHAMRTIGAAEKALEWMIARINDDRKKTFGKHLSSHGVILEWVAKSRIEIDAARLIVLNAAIKIDQGDAKSALKEIAQAKVLVPQAALTVIDRAVQAYGAAGVSQDTPLAYLWALIRTLRIADGPDEVHLQQLGRRENRARKDEIMQKLKWQKEEGARLLESKSNVIDVVVEIR